jgi:hypothetical protein
MIVLVINFEKDYEKVDFLHGERVLGDYIIVYE